MGQDEERPAPDVLLEAAKKEGRGRLKIFLGAYPGVGKTFSMLQAAQDRRREKVDVVVAVVETHGRAETEALLSGLEILPRKMLAYRGHTFGEMDLDKVLARRPALAVVDELAHSNIPGSSHAKRWHDVEDLLSAGIDVYTTLNIQHLESLNDVVARISRIRVRETLPDKVLELADEIELIDLPPDDLLQRLREGKVYVRDQVGRALRHFFSKGNLTAFRELAMRVAAARIDAQMINYMRTHAIPGPWPVQDRLLVCVNEAGVAKTLVRTARRIAERQRIPWVALYIQTPRYESLSDEAKTLVADTLRLAESLGGETVTLHAESKLADEIIAYARTHNVSQILIGRPRKRRMLGLFRENVGASLLRRAAAFEVTLVSADGEEAGGDLIEGISTKFRIDLRAFQWTTLAVAVATGGALLVAQFLPLPNVSLVYVLAVLLTAMRYGLAPSIYASLLSFLSYNFLFTEPYYTLLVFRDEDLFTIIFFLLISILVGNLASRLKAQIEAMRAANRRTDNLYTFSRKVAAVASLDDLLWAAVHHVALNLQCRSLVLLPDDRGHLDIAAGYPPDDQLSPTDWGAAKWSWENGKPAGWSSDTLPGASWLFLPLKTTRGLIGLLGISYERRGTVVSAEQRRVLDTIADQIAVSIERVNLATEFEEARVFTEAEKLRAALLASISHDLRTPLVSIIGSATTLNNTETALRPEDRKELLQTIIEEGERLNRFVQNLLDMTRLGYGALQPNKEWCDLREVAGRAVRRLRKTLGARELSLNMPDDLPNIQADPVLLEQVLTNLLDNAIKYTAETGVIRVMAEVEGSQMVVRVMDDGPGIPNDAREAVFDVFYRVRSGDTQTAGTGLGLSICRGIIEAHGGTIVAEEPVSGKGASIALRLPLGVMPGVEDKSEQASEDLVQPAEQRAP